MFAPLLLPICLLATLLAPAAPAGGPQAAQRGVTNIGIEGIVELPWDGPPLVVRPAGPKAPIELRLVDLGAEEPTKGYQIHYIGTRAGHYDLREYISRADGQPLSGVEPIPVKVEELLPANHVGNLETVVDPPLPRPWPYRLLLVAGGIVWLAAAVSYIAGRIAARPRRAVAAILIEPTLMERLRPLIEAGLAGHLGPQEKARLEQLLIGHWRRRLALRDCSAVEVLHQMHNHPEASAMLAQLEAWLHCPPERGTVDLHKLLAPYRNGEAVASNSHGAGL